MSKITGRESMDIIEESKLDPAEKYYVAQILQNYYTRGLLWHDDQNSTDETIAVTELIVLANCLREYQGKKFNKLKEIILSCNDGNTYKNVEELKRLVSLGDNEIQNYTGVKQ